MRNTRLNIGCHLSNAKGFLPMGRTALSIGASTCQFFTRNPRGGAAKALDPADVAAFLALSAEHGLGPFLAHAPYTLNPCAAEEKTRRFALEVLQGDLERLKAFPGTMYNFHPGSHVGQGIEAGVALIAAQLNAVLTPETPTLVLLETMSGKGSEVGGSFGELRAVIDRVECADRLGVCLDTCHVHDAGYDIAGDLEGVLEEFDRVIGLSRLRAIHLNDSLNPLGSRKDRHAKISRDAGQGDASQGDAEQDGAGQGRIGLEALTRVINHPRLRDLPFYLETPNELPGYAEEIALLRRAWREQ